MQQVTLIANNVRRVCVTWCASRRTYQGVLSRRRGASKSVSLSANQRSKPQASKRKRDKFCGAHRTRTTKPNVLETAAVNDQHHNGIRAEHLTRDPRRVTCGQRVISAHCGIPTRTSDGSFPVHYLHIHRLHQRALRQQVVDKQKRATRQPQSKGVASERTAVAQSI